MFQPRIVLHSTDYSDCALGAFEVAVDIATHHQARLLVLHVAETLGPELVSFGEAVNEPQPASHLALLRRQLSESRPVPPGSCRRASPRRGRSRCCNCCYRPRTPLRPHRHGNTRALPPIAVAHRQCHPEGSTVSQLRHPHSPHAGSPVCRFGGVTQLELFGRVQAKMQRSWGYNHSYFGPDSDEQFK